MRPLLRVIGFAILLACGGVQAAELQVVSAGALEPGLEAAVQNFRSASSQAVRIRYGTAPRLREMLQDAEAPDLLLAPMRLLDEMAAARRLAGRPVPLGRVGVGMAVRVGAPVPVVEDAEGLRRALTQAQAVIYNRASTGMYLDRLFEQMGLTALVSAKARRYAAGADVMDHLLRGSGDELGFGAIPEIRMVRELRYVGPLPLDVQSYTTYGAALLPDGPAAAAVLLRWLVGPESRAVFDAAGIEPPR
ncbi:molybdate ABC transporter substrate-binding protein [Paeniroseomonas aquatica]|uniref:Substrate-binding domain-containing protein n=1 Tax=Paeniroseomonas aquatica TaxID=373043 RepID=A0ABT8A5M9_9PROT|nr:substrate-binding domain-containing protein [Paeniroseomonas aquatica]MDN3565088.1 substrate-binding domain-containing protein [Paeniroseomonas aquatica]